MNLVTRALTTSGSHRQEPMTWHGFLSHSTGKRYYSFAFTFACAEVLRTWRTNDTVDIELWEFISLLAVRPWPWAAPTPLWSCPSPHKVAVSARREECGHMRAICGRKFVLQGPPSIIASMHDHNFSKLKFLICKMKILRKQPHRLRRNQKRKFYISIYFVALTMYQAVLMTLQI